MHLLASSVSEEPVSLQPAGHLPRLQPVCASAIKTEGKAPALARHSVAYGRRQAGLARSGQASGWPTPHGRRQCAPIYPEARCAPVRSSPVGAPAPFCGFTPAQQVQLVSLQCVCFSKHEVDV